MRSPPAALGLLLAATLMCGCFSRHPGPIYRVGDEKPPTFLAGAAAPALTNLGGFSAHVEVVTQKFGGGEKIQSGEMLGREGRLIFQPNLGVTGKRARTQGGLFYIWDEEVHAGSVMSDALQGFAPVTLEPTATGPVNAANDGVREEIGKHPCHRSEALVAMSDGTQARLTLWRADDEGHFPLRIQVVDTHAHTTLNFSKVVHQLPPAAVFRPPEGFTRYPTATALINELIVREASIAKKNFRSEDFDEPSGPQQPPSWNSLQPPPQ